MTDANASPWLAALVFPVFFVTLWVAVTFALSRSGWHAFALKYPATVNPAEKRYTVRRASFSSPLAGYRNAINAVFLPEGLYLSPVFVFRAFHTPILIPWSAVKQVFEKRDWLGRRYTIRIEDDGRKLDLHLSKKVEGALRHHCPVAITSNH
jgi:hypothetical protein